MVTDRESMANELRVPSNNGPDESVRSVAERRERMLRRLFEQDKRYTGCEGMTTDPVTDDEKAAWK